MANLTFIEDLLKKCIEKEKRDEAFLKKIKENEVTLRTEEGNIKCLLNIKKSLKEGLECKLLENSKSTIKKEIMSLQKLIWNNILRSYQDKLQMEETKLEALQQSICTNRISFCGGINEFIGKVDLQESIHGYLKEQHLLPQSGKSVKKDLEEFNNLIDEKQSLERELEELLHEQEKIEEAKKLKLQLQAEPSCGDEFRRMQQSLKDIKVEMVKTDAQIRALKYCTTFKDSLTPAESQQQVEKHKCG